MRCNTRARDNWIANERLIFGRPGKLRGLALMARPTFLTKYITSFSVVADHHQNSPSWSLGMGSSYRDPLACIHVSRLGGGFSSAGPGVPAHVGDCQGCRRLSALLSKPLGSRLCPSKRVARSHNGYSFRGPS